jgi:Lamin Tail Domain
MTPTVRNVGPFLVVFTLAMITTGGLTIAAGSSSASAASSLGTLNRGIYGAGMGYDTKANLWIGGPDGQKVAIRFKATTTSALNSVRFVQRGGAGYSLGTGGTMTLSVRADDGTGHPSATSLAQRSYTPGNPGGHWEKYDPVTFSSPATLTAGKIYYIVFTNASTSNYISVNSVYVYNAPASPRQPMFSDSEYGLMYTSGSWGALARGYTPVVDLAYANGVHGGSSYVGALIDRYATISGASKMARERFTVSGGNKTVSSASIRLRRSSGTSPVVVTLETAAGSLIEAVSIPAASIPISAPGGDNGGAVWATANFISSHVLTNGTGYNLRISTASGTTYTMFPILAGPADGLNSWFFPDGKGWLTTNGTDWTLIYDWKHADLQFYFTLAPAKATSPIQFGRIQYNSPGTDTTANASVNGEYVVIRNLGYTARSLTGWTVRDAAKNHVYRFGTFTLGARKSIVLRTGKGTNTSITRYWGLGWHVWSNTGDRVYLRSAAGTGMDYCAWTTSGVGYKVC